MGSIIKKLSKFITSRMLYLFLGLFFSLAIFVVHAAWNSKVNSGDTLTSTLWNDVVDKLVELDGRTGTLEKLCIKKENCEWTGKFACGSNMICPAGKVLVGFQDGTSCGVYNFGYCCDLVLSSSCP